MGRAVWRAEVFRHFDSQHLAERSHQACGLRGGGHPGAGSLVHHEGLELAAELGGCLDQLDQPDVAVGDLKFWRFGPAGGAEARGARLGQGSGLPAHYEAVEALDDTDDAGVDEHEQGV